MEKSKTEIENHSYFYSLELEGVNCFKDKQVLDLSDGKGNFSTWTIILGDNGTGKTTLLRVLDGMQPINDEEYIPLIWHYRPFLKSKSDLIISLSFSDKTFDKYFAIYYNNLTHQKGSFEPKGNNSYPFILSYGASRRMNKKPNLSLREKDYKLTSLFDETIELINVEEWFLENFLKTKIAEDKIKQKIENQLKLVTDLLVEILPDVNSIRIKPLEDVNSKIVVEIETPYGWVNINDLSYGYQTITSLIVDIASKMMDKYPESKNPLSQPVIILIDEIDLHLHPKWQRIVIEKLSYHFPKAQFIVTAHSPLIVQAAEDINANIVVCKKEGDRVVIDSKPDTVKGWRVDQILTSDLFEIESSRSIEVEKLKREKINILLNNSLSNEDKARLKFINEKLDLPIFSNKESIEAEEIIKKAAALLKK